jgi:hypothetical protein
MATISTDELWASMNADTPLYGGAQNSSLKGTQTSAVQQMMSRIALKQNGGKKQKVHTESLAQKVISNSSKTKTLDKKKKKKKKKKQKEKKVTLSGILGTYGAGASAKRAKSVSQLEQDIDLLVQGGGVDRRKMTFEEVLPTLTRTINCLDSDDLLQRKRAIKTLRDTFESENRPSDDVCSELYDEMMKPLLKRFADQSEFCRLGGIWLVNFFLSLTLDMGPTLPYLYPVVTERSSLQFGYDEEGKEFVRDPEKQEAKKRGKAFKTEQQEGCVYKHTVVEPSEEVRLESMKLLRMVVGKILDSTAPTQLGPYFTDTILLCAVGVCDPFPDLKLVSYSLVRDLAHKLPPGMKHFAVGFIKLLIPALGHRHAKVRLSALETVDALMQCPDEMKRKGAGTEAITSLIGHRDANVLPIACFYHGEARVNAFAKIVIDNSVAVREKFAAVLGSWLHDLPDRYDYFSRLLPYMLSCLSDESPQVASLALSWMEKIGKQWEQEHQEDVIERRQYGVDGDRHAQRDITYPPPFKGRPRIGARLFVRGHCRRFLKPLMRELGDWKDETRVHAARLLRVCIVYMEEHITGQLHEIVGCFCRSALYEHGKASQSWMPECVGIVASFVDPKPFLALLLPLVGGEVGGASSARVPLRSSRSQALAVLRPLIKALNVKRLLPHGKQIAEALSDSSLATSREVGERKRHFSAIRTLSEKLVDDIQKASAAHFQSTGRFISIEQPLRRLHEAMGDMLALAEEDASNNVVGGDELLKEATMAKDSLDTLVSKFGESNNNIIGGGKVVKASVEGEKEDENDINMEEDSSELFGVE